MRAGRARRSAVPSSSDGHTVAIIDRRAEAFDRLGADFAGRTVQGIGFDRDRLIEAGIEEAGAVAAVTSGDNSNILIARVARENFGIDHVVARIYDPRRAVIYQRLGHPDRRHRGVDHRPGDAPPHPGGPAGRVDRSDGQGLPASTASLADGWAGHPLDRYRGGRSAARVVAINRMGAATVPTRAHGRPGRRRAVRGRRDGPPGRGRHGAAGAAEEGH